MIIYRADIYIYVLYKKYQMLVEVMLTTILNGLQARPIVVCACVKLVSVKHKHNALRVALKNDDSHWLG